MILSYRNVSVTRLPHQLRANRHVTVGLETDIAQIGGQRLDSISLVCKQNKQAPGNTKHACL